MLNNKIMGAPLWLWIVGFVVITMFLKKKENFGDVNGKTKVYNFNTSWCGWSKKFQPEWNKFQDMVKSNPNVEAHDIKCDDESNESMCKEYNVPGYPYVVIEHNGERDSYNGPRTALDLMKSV